MDGDEEKDIVKIMKKEIEFDPIKHTVNGKQAERVIWSTNIINIALQAIEEGKPLKASPFYMKNTKLLKPELVYKRTKEEIDDYIRCKTDPVYFASKCYLMTPEGLKPCKLRDYQIDYLRHLQKNRFSIFLSCRQSGKSLNMLSNINIKINKKILQNCLHISKINYFNINDNIYSLPIFELYNLYCKQTLLWKVKYHLYKIIYNLSNGRNKGNENKKES